MFARALSISLKYNWQELSVLFVRQDRTNGKLYLSLKLITVSKDPLYRGFVRVTQVKELFFH